MDTIAKHIARHTAILATLEAMPESEAGSPESLRLSIYTQRAILEAFQDLASEVASEATIAA